MTPLNSKDYKKVKMNNLNRRDSLKKLAGIGALVTGTPGIVKKIHEESTEKHRYPESKRIKTICTHCAVGCGVIAEVDKGVWVRQDTVFDHPISRGAYCCKGSSLVETVRSEKRLKFPLKKEKGEWKRISWENGISEISDKLLQIRKDYGPDAVMWLGSAKVSNEMAYLQRKFAAFWGTNNVDHQARICHSTTVAGVANTWGYGAMTNSINDIRHSKLVFLIGSNAAEAHPVAMQHIFHAKEANGAKVICVDPRYTRTAAKSDEYVRIRSGTDVAYIMGLINIIFSKGLEDKEFIKNRTFGLEEVKKEAAKYTPEKVKDITGVPTEYLEKIAVMLAANKPGTVIWCMGGTQHHIGSSNTRAYCILQLVLGNMGKAGGGTNILRGHDNVQGATDMCVLSNSLPAYYGLSDGAWKHWCRVWGVNYDWIKSRFDSPEMMNRNGFTIARWYEGALQNVEDIDQRSNIKAVVAWGCSGNSQSEFNRVVKALNDVDLVVVIDLFPTAVASHSERKENLYLLPACSQFETSGSVTASNRTNQWRFKVVEPVYESRPDYEIIMDFAKKLGFYNEFTKNIKKIPEDITKEINNGSRTIGYTGQTPERLKKHTENWGLFSFDNLKADENSPFKGEYYGLPWPCWNKNHPGTPILYDISKPVAEGGLPFRNRFGLERNGVSLLAEEGSANPGSKINGGYSEFSDKSFDQLGIKLSIREKNLIKGFNWKTDLSGIIVNKAIKYGMAPFGNAKARAVVWGWPDPVPVHREPLHSPRPDLIAKYPSYEDKKHHFRLTTKFRSEQKADWVEKYPLIVSTGRIVEYMGGGAETRSNKYLAELQPEMYAEINFMTADEYHLADGDKIWIESPNGGKIKVKVKISKRVSRSMIFLPFHFAGEIEGETRDKKYPEGTVPYALGAVANIVTNYGYDIMTQMQETKTGLCRIWKA